jgi:hypothetical protein
MIKFLKRYVLSIRAFLWIIFYSSKTRIARSFLFEKKFRRVFIVCPGPTANTILDESFTDSDIVILINHAIKLAEYVDLKKNIYYFSLDYTRTSEIYQQSHSLFLRVKKIFLPYHFFHLTNKALIKEIDIVLLPKVTFSFTYGLMLKNNGPENINIMRRKFCANGFGTLASFLQIAFNFKPDEVVFCGCNFGKMSGSQYFDNLIPIRNDTPFDKIKNDVSLILDQVDFKITYK